MKKLMACVVVLFLFAAFMGESHAETYISFVFGNDLVEWMREYEKVIGGETDANIQLAEKFVGYFLGVFDATNPLLNYNVTQETTGKQIIDDPKPLNQGATNLVVIALTIGFAKKEVKKGK